MAKISRNACRRKRRIDILVIDSPENSVQRRLITLKELSNELYLRNYYCEIVIAFKIILQT